MNNKQKIKYELEQVNECITANKHKYEFNGAKDFVIDNTGKSNRTIMFYKCANCENETMIIIPKREN